MATIQDVFSHIYTTEAHLGDVAVKNGQIILCVDSEKLYIDHGTTRVSTSDVVYVENEAALPLAPLDKFYITQDTGDIFFYLNGEWKKLNDTFRDYTAFEVYANDTIISPGEHAELGTITVEIPVQMTETFALRTTTPEADSDVVIDWGDGTVQKVKDGEHGGYTGPDGEGRYIAKMTHTYAATGKYVVKVYGKDYFCLSHAPSHVSDASNMQCRILADDLPIASHLTNLTAFAYGTLKLVTVQCASYKYLHRTTNHAQMFTNDKNLLSVTGFEDLVMISRGAEGCFQFCENMHTCDFNGVLCSNNPRAMYAMYQNCYALAINIGTFFPTKFVSRALNFTNTFTHMHAMTGTVDPNQFWGDPNIDWQGFSNCFYGCSDKIRSQVPTSWGGTSSTEIVGDLPVAKLSLNGTLPNTANGLLMLNASGKVDSSFLPPQAAVNIDNYTSNNTIKLTSTAGAVNLISNTGEVGLYSGSTSHIKANVDTIELTATTLSFNGNDQNVAGGIAVIDKSTGKLPESILPDTGLSSVAVGSGLSGDGTTDSPLSLDLTSYTSTGGINLNSASNTIRLGGAGVTIAASTVNIGDNGGVTHVNGALILDSSAASPISIGSASVNTAHGLVVLGSDGKIPTTLYDATIDLSDYQTNGPIKLTTTSNTGDGSGDITITTSENIILKGGVYDKIEIGNATMHITSEAAVLINGQSGFVFQSNGTDVISESSGHLTLADDDININGTLHYNSAMLNEANGLVQLNSSGKIPGELYDASVDLSNYSGSSVAITATGSSGDLIKFAASETGASITFTDDAYIHITGDVQTIIDVGNGVDISSSTSNTADTLRINGNALNTAGGLVRLGSDGKIPTSLYEAGSTEIDWSNITASIVSFGSSGSNIGPFSVYADSITLEGSNIAISSSSAPTLNGHAQNTANGFAIVGDDGKLPSSIIPESTGGTVDLTDYVGTGNISLTTGKENLLTLKADTMMEGYESTFKLGTGASAAGGNGAYLELNGGSFGVTGYGAYFGSTNSQMSIFQINAQTLMYNNAEQNQPNGLVVLGSDGKIPSGLYDVGSSTVDLSNYTTSDAISLSADSGITLQTLGTSFYMNGSGANITMTDPLLSLSLNNHLPNTAGGFVIVPDDGKLPSSILPESTGSSVDLSAYTGGINLNSTNDSAVAIKFNSGNSTYNAALTMDAAGVTLSGYGDVTLQHTGGSYLRLTSGEATLSSNSSLTLSASSRLTISAKEGIYLGGAGLNTAGGLVKVGDDGKIPSSLYDAGTGGDTSALETRVTTLETTVGTLNTTVDEILADYGEGSGALVYRVVASATEPENPTEGMLWIKTE